MINRITELTARFVGWLGPARAQILFLWLALTGLASLILNALDPKTNPWRVPVQSGLSAVFIIVAAVIIGTRLPQHQRQRALVISVPSLVSFVLAAILPQFWLLFIPFGIGWVIIAFLASQSRVRREYQAAIKHLRKGEYDDAIRVMTDLISEEPQVADHYRFRAELFRLHGKLKRAQKDYQKVIELMPDSGVGYNGLAEVFLQDGDNVQALGFAQKAYAMERSYWVAPYNLGMIEERLGQLGAAVEHLREALKVGIPDSRHRLLVHLWLIRAQVGQNNLTEAEAELTALRNERPGLREWKTVFESEEAAVLKDVLEADIQQAEGLIEGQLSLSEVGDASSSRDSAR